MKIIDINVLVLLFLLFGFATKGFSQANVIIHLGPAIPISDFTSDDLNNENAGGAAIGISAGIQGIYPLANTGLGIFGGIDVNYNGLKNSVKDELKSAYGRSADYTFYKYINVPISAGLNYTYQADGSTGVFINAGMVANFLKITNMTIEGNRQDIVIGTELAQGVGLKIGGGFLVNQRVVIAIDYLRLGNYDIRGTVSGGSFIIGGTNRIEAEMKVDLLTATIGLKF